MILNSETNHDSGGGGSLPTTAKVTFVNNNYFETDFYLTYINNGQVVSEKINFSGHSSSGDLDVIIPSYISVFSTDGTYGLGNLGITPTSAGEQTGFTDNMDGIAIYVTGGCTITIG